MPVIRVSRRTCSLLLEFLHCLPILRTAVVFISQTSNASEHGRMANLPRRTLGSAIQSLNWTQHHASSSIFYFSSCIEVPHQRASKGKNKRDQWRIQHRLQNFSHGRRRHRRQRHSLCALFDTTVGANGSAIRTTESGIRVQLFDCDDGAAVTELNLRRVGPCHEALTDASSVGGAPSIYHPATTIIYVLITSMSVISTSLERR